MKRAGSGAYLRRSGPFLELQFEGAVTQTRMLRWAPDVLWVGYTRSMLAALWLHPAPRWIGIVGLGGGAQVKFLHRHLPLARLDVVENDAGVLGLRDAFRIPRDDARLQVVQGDGAAWLRDHPGAFDVLLLDAYDAGGIPAHMGSHGFHALCRDALTPGGVMASNLYDTDLRAHEARLRQVFGGQCLRLPEPGMSNEVAFAWRGTPTPPPASQWLRTWGLSARWQLRGGVQRLARAWARR
ncbi:transferase [Stenotrophomonas sp. HITSZ_GD]|uniref:spermine/spermidine synthase domain-containing protein n=1 Tax=Stenotrophomonas sp. HITSZ_GD TaxID=3037248 RepID=UPI00240D80C3|nr:transferase [Stenotrophomonas sp. HITSZ_GD]MDG2524737.1 transferase [Stenotrophomonas sp. HITSZ_GD]